MKTAIVYVSTHHGNTKKLVDAIASKHGVTAIDAVAEPNADLTGYDCIGFAAGIAFGSFYKQILQMMRNGLPEGKKVFLLYTCGTMSESYANSAVEIAKERHCTVLGKYGCLGFDTYGPFKLIGGIAKGHPTDEEIYGAVSFYEGIIE